MSSLPVNFSHVAVSNHKDELLTLTQSPLPQIASNQVLIKVAAAGVNGPDLAQRQGIYPPPPNASPILGLEVSGEVCAVGDEVVQWQVGDRICALVQGGGYAQYVSAHQDHCLPLPESISLVQGAALPETLFTVWGNLFQRAKLSSSDTLLIHGASGGLGNCAIQLAKAFDATVIVTSGSKEKCQHCLSLGADHTFEYSSPTLFNDIYEVTGQHGVSVVFDMAAGDFVNLNLKLLKHEGRMVTVALQRGITAQVDVFRLMSKRITWTGSTLRPQPDEMKANIAADLKQFVLPLLNQGLCLPHIHRTFDLSEVEKAHQLMLSKAHVGKIVLTVD
ncbi:NAD(P)H-quinone oxidoreductase [Parashewanella curva]|uniref:NAD(P)H-quinone oxidoreductase n=1 Tax=Parashewanella curva TaxID=2338552 RepID=A0A3L8Q1I2_9GAMM|nr:NAD(P)H-quinone oxidoreductase [Parashewanella curva]RLV60593.1 NAD(P)H-quinone oxidoreductase [Parashewanella curva]